MAVSIGSAARPYFLAALFKSVGKPILVIAPNTEKAGRLVEDLKAFSVEAKLFPEVETMPYDSLSPSPESVGRRLSILDEMTSGLTRIWVAPITLVMRNIAPASAGLHLPISLKVDDEADLYDFAERLIKIGYIRTPLVEGHGQFSMRGDIIDIFASNLASPMRVEFFGDEIESIRSFSVSSQRSISNLEGVKIYGCRQILLDEETAQKTIVRIGGNYPDHLEEEIGKLKDRQYFEGVDKYLPFFYEDATTVLDYLSKDALLVVDEPEETAQLAEQHILQQQSYIDHLVEHKAIINPPRPYFKNPKEITAGRVRIELFSIGKNKSANNETSLAVLPVRTIAGKIEQLKDMIEGYTKLGLKVFIALPDESQVARMANILSKNGIAYSTQDRASKKEVSLMVGNLSGGFSSTDIGLAIVSSTDIFGRRVIQRKVKFKTKGQAISDVADLRIGDYVVHSAHGIAVYAGLQKREVADIIRDYAVLEYAGGDRLFVPTDQLDRITKYIGAAGEVPTVSRLGGSEWLKAKKKAKASAKKVAYNLLSLYAERSNAKGFAFTPDSPWQKELEDSFAYDETPDQLTAMEDVKQDMEAPKPMDRLVCGDVGYGKTEVAVRAAFKAIVDGKQVIVLVPTTILAQQHFATFSERLLTFPVTVEMVSRFKSRAEQQDIIERFNNGKVDILIGTHRLLRPDIKPFDLGLLVIDEEQRFGVNDKEKLRNFKKSVDVLTLSATPIPRTLQISLAGIRDMSIIETPPEDRHPIVTHVGRYDGEMMVQAIRRELGRGGQVYFVHNRVETIARVAKRIRELVPEAHVAIAHGQMSEHQLEKVMLKFLNKEYNVLICTTIIESGIDIPSANTLIVDRAEMLGLAQLYQLRGRVGRSDQRAYAYFFFSPQKFLTMPAFERLKTINEFTELGSGMKIALRDLEIRGAGNLLGAEQHGHMSAIGFELYVQMLREAIDEFEGNPTVGPVEIKIDLPVSAYLPKSYIAEESLRIEAYKRIITARSIQDVEEISFELEDRYGKYPNPVEKILGIAKIRLLAKELGLTEVVYRGGRVKISPFQLSKQQELVLGKSYNNLIFKSERHYLLITRMEPDKIVDFVFALFNDIISALTTGVMIGRKAR